MITAQDVQIVQDTFTQATTVVISLGANANYDAVASALSLYLSCKNAGKSAHIVCSTPMRVEFSYLVGVDEVKEKLGNKSLMISFEYSEEAVEKVSYAISEDKTRFNLLVTPKTGAKSLDPSTVQFSGSGAEADMVFVVGASSFEDLGELYQLEQYFFEGTFSVSLNAFEGQQFTRVALNSSGQTCLAEGVGVMLEAMGLPPADDVATNILSSIEQATNKFQSFGMTPESFEMVARLMRNGARRSSVHQSVSDNVSAGGNFGNAMANSTPPVYLSPTQNGQTYVSNLPPMYEAQETRVAQDNQPTQSTQIVQAPQTVQAIPPATPVSTSSFAQALRAKQSGRGAVSGGSVGGGTGVNSSGAQLNVSPQSAQSPQESQRIFQIQHGNGMMQQPFTQNGQTTMQNAQSSAGIAQAQQSTQPPQEWMQPKVFTGATRV